MCACVHVCTCVCGGQRSSSAVIHWILPMLMAFWVCLFACLCIYVSGVHMWCVCMPVWVYIWYMCMQVYTMCMCIGRRLESGIFFNFSLYLLSQGHHLKPELSDLASIAGWLSPGIFCLHLVHTEIKGRFPYLLGIYVRGLKFPRILFPCLPSTRSMCTHHMFSFCVGGGVLEGKWSSRACMASLYWLFPNPLSYFTNK